MQRAVDLYIAAQTKGDTSGLPLAAGLGYMENVAPANINNGLIKTPMKIDHQRSLLDTATCQTFTETIVTNTLPIPDEKRFDKLTVLSIAPLLARAISEVFEIAGLRTVIPIASDETEARSKLGA